MQEGKFELGPTVAAGGAAMDEVIVSAIALVEHALKQSGGQEALESINTASTFVGLVGGGGS